MIIISSIIIIISSSSIALAKWRHPAKATVQPLGFAMAIPTKNGQTWPDFF
jgi:hypothetical protein